MMTTIPGGRAVSFLALLTGAALLIGLGGCSSSFGSGGGGSAPTRTYVVLPNGSTEPVQTVTRPPGE